MAWIRFKITITENSTGEAAFIEVKLLAFSYYYLITGFKKLRYSF